MARDDDYKERENGDVRLYGTLSRSGSSIRTHPDQFNPGNSNNNNNGASNYHRQDSFQGRHHSQHSANNNKNTGPHFSHQNPHRNPSTHHTHTNTSGRSHHNNNNNNTRFNNNHGGNRSNRSPEHHQSQGIALPRRPSYDDSDHSRTKRMRALSPDSNTKSGDFHHRSLPSPTTSSSASSASHQQHSQRRALPPQDEVIPGKQFHNNHNRHSNSNHTNTLSPHRQQQRTNSFTNHNSHESGGSSHLGNGSSSNTHGQSSNVIALDQRSSVEHWQPNNHQNYQAENESSANSRSTTNSNHQIQPDTIACAGRAGASPRTSLDYTSSGGVDGPTLPKPTDTKHLGSRDKQLSPVQSQSSSHSRHAPTVAPDTRTRRRSPSPTLEERRQAQAISRTFLELRIAEAAMTQAQHQTQLGPQQGIGVVSNKEDDSTRIPTALTSPLPGSPSSSLTPQLSQTTTDVSPAIPDADEVATGTTAGAPIDAVNGGEDEDEESSETLIQTLITPQQSPPSINRYTIASAIIPTATRTTIASTVPEYGSTPEKNVQEGEQTEGGVNGSTAGEHPIPATSSATSMATSTLDNTSADTSNPEADTPASVHLLMSNASYISDDHVKHQANPADIDPSTEGVKSNTEHLLETIKDLGKAYPHHQPQLRPGLGPMDVPVEMTSETIVYAVPSIGSEHYNHEEDPSLESTLLSSQGELSDSTISLSQGKQESKQEELATANPSDSMTAVLLDTIQPLLSHASPPSALSGPQNVQGDGITTMESDQGTTLGNVVVSLASNINDGDFTTVPILNSFDSDMEMSPSTSMDVDIDTDASGLLNSDTVVDQGVLDIEQETDMSVDLSDVALPSEILSKELMYDAVFRDDKDQQLVEATLGQVANEKSGGEIRDSNENPTMAVVEVLGPQGDVTSHLDATYAGYAEVIQPMGDKDVGLGLPDSAGDRSISTQDTSTKVDEDYTNEDLVKTLLMESVPVAEPAIAEMGMVDTETLSTEAPDLFKTLLGDALSAKPEPMERSLPLEATGLGITETTPEGLPVNDTIREKPLVVTGQTVNPAIEEAELRYSALEAVDRTTNHSTMNKSPLDDESVKTIPEASLSYVAETEEIQDVSEMMSDVDTDGPQTVPNVRSLEPTSSKDKDERVHTREKSPLSSSVMTMPGKRRRSATSPTVSRQATADNHQSVSPFPGRSRHQHQRDHFPPSPVPHPSWHFVPGADLALLSEMTASTADLRRFRREMQWLEERTQRPRRGTVSEQVLDKALGLTRNVPPPPSPQTKPQHRRTRDERGKGGIGNARYPPDLGSTSVQLSTESRLALSMLKMDLLSDQEEQTRLERDHEALKRSLARVEAKVSEKKKAQETAEQEIQEMLERHPAMETELLRVRQLENECLEMREQQRQQAESEIRKLEATLQMLKQQHEQGQGQGEGHGQEQHSSRLVRGPATMMS